MIQEAVIIAYGRAPIGKAKKGSLAQEHPVDFAGQVLQGVMNKVPQLGAEMVSDVIVGCAKPEKQQGQNIARLIAQRSGFPDSVCGQTVNRFCASGLQAIATASNSITVGQASVLAAGGVESMTAIPMGFAEEYHCGWLQENIPDLYAGMGITAENVAQAYNVSRQEMDSFAVESHSKAFQAQEAGLFNREIIPITTSGGTVFTMDEGIRPGSTMEVLGQLKPSFLEGGMVTAGNSSQTSDSAAFVLLSARDKAEALGIKPIARMVGFAVGGVPAGIMGVGPMVAIPEVMQQTGLSLDDMDVIELNEAFAAQAIACIRQLNIDPAKVNPRGGAIAMGHPLGATGAILTCKALSYLEDTDGRYALVSMCIGGGMGAAGIFERL